MAAVAVSSARGVAATEKRARPEVIAFEKELRYELATVKKLASRREDHALRQRV